MLLLLNLVQVILYIHFFLFKLVYFVLFHEKVIYSDPSYGKQCIHCMHYSSLSCIVVRLLGVSTFFFFQNVGFIRIWASGKLLIFWLSWVSLMILVRTIVKYYCHNDPWIGCLKLQHWIFYEWWELSILWFWGWLGCNLLEGKIYASVQFIP